MNTPGTLYFMIGKMGAGKSTYSAQFAAQSNAVLISADDWLSGLYPDEIQEFSDFVQRHNRLQRVLGPHVQQILQAGTSVILDFPANTKKSRQWYLQLASAVSAVHEAIYLDIDDALCLKRLAQRRLALPERARFDTPEMFETVTRFFEAPSEDEGLNLKTVTHSD